MKLPISIFTVPFCSTYLLFLFLFVREVKMSRFKGSPSKSPFRSPPRLYEAERDAIIEDELRLKSAIRAESDYRRINDELALLQVKVRHTS